MSTSDALTPTPPSRVIVRTALRHFVILSVITLVVLGAGAYLVCRRVAQDAALMGAMVRAETLADSVAAPLVDSEIRDAEPASLARLDAVMRHNMETGSIAHVKLWSDQGRLLWSDEAALIGRTFELDPEDVELFTTQRTTAELSPLDKPENVAEQADEELLEVYSGTEDADGVPLLFEAYYSTAAMREQERRIMLAILPVALGGLLLFQAAILPLALSLARRVERGEQQRSRLLRQTVLTTHRERLRIARDLHDGVVQDLAGLRYALPLVATHLPDGPEAASARDTLEQSREILGRDVEALRSLLVDIHPPGLAGAAFRDAVEDLAERTRRAGPEVDVSMPGQPEWSIEVARVCYRVIQEALRNVATHSGAAHAWVEVVRDGPVVRAIVSDDGRGLPEASAEEGVDALPARPPAEGHVGLRLLRDHLEDLGGSLEVGPRPGGGTLLEARVPVDLLGSG
ncbi:sensor histidine kinase [Phycicoccus avicenniae]|uniref:sensor histidine kinase n=1 Tax=Phycicoccus avicenniae TaxID=2828860 RepID=UPI003D2686AE